MAQSEAAASRQIESLRRLASSMRERAAPQLERPRAEHTARNRNIAAGARNNARHDLTQADRLDRIADELAGGRAPHLRSIRNLARLEALEAVVDQARDRQKERTGTRTGPLDLTLVAVPFPELDSSNLLSVLLQHPKPASPRRRSLEARARQGQQDPTARQVRIEDAEDLAFVRELAKATGDEWLARNLKLFDRIESMGLADPAKLRAAVEEYSACCRGERRQPTELEVAREAALGVHFAGFYVTPAPLADRVAAAARIPAGASVLEPSAGRGDLAAAASRAQPLAKVHVIERDDKLRRYLKALGLDVIGDDFLKLDDDERFDRVVMNPPFEHGQDVDHVRQAFEHLAPRGRLVAIMSEHAFEAADRRSVEFREWLAAHHGRSEKLPDDSFRESGATVRTRLVTVDRLPEVVPAAKLVAQHAAAPGGKRSMSGRSRVLAEGDHVYGIGGWAFLVHRPRDCPADDPCSTLVTTYPPGVRGPSAEGITFPDAFERARIWAAQHSPKDGAERPPPEQLEETLLGRRRTLRLEGRRYLIAAGHFGKDDKVGELVFLVPRGPPSALPPPPASAPALRLRVIRHRPYIARRGLPAIGGGTSGQGGRLTEIEVTDGRVTSEAFVREATVREGHGFLKTAGERMREKVDRTSEPQSLELAVLGPWPFEEVATLVHQVDPDHRPVRRNARFTAKWARGEFDVSNSATLWQQNPKSTRAQLQRLTVVVNGSWLSGGAANESGDQSPVKEASVSDKTWPSNPESARLVAEAVRLGRPFPWDESLTGKAADLARRAWVEVIWKKDPDPQLPALQFLMGSDERQATYPSTMPWYSRPDPVIFAAPAAGFKVPPRVLRDVEIRNEKFAIREAGRTGNPQEVVAPDPELVARLKVLRSLVKRRAQLKPYVYGVHGRQGVEDAAARAEASANVIELPRQPRHRSAAEIAEDEREEADYGQKLRAGMEAEDAAFAAEVDKHLVAAYLTARWLPWQTPHPDFGSAFPRGHEANWWLQESRAWADALWHETMVDESAQYLAKPPEERRRLALAGEVNFNDYYLPQMILAADAAGFPTDRARVAWARAQYAAKPNKWATEIDGYADRMRRFRRMLPTTAAGRSDFDDRVAAHRERLEHRVETKSKEANDRWDASRARLEQIPFGQPILVGHHSEGRHRRDIERSHADADRALKAQREAESAMRALEGIDRARSISSDDPDAVTKLHARVAEVKHQRELGQKVNRAVRSKQAEQKLADLGLTPERIVQLLKGDFMGRKGIPGYRFKNLAAEERRLADRIKELEGRAATVRPIDHVRGLARATWDDAENRVAVILPDVPKGPEREKRTKTMRSAGFVWSPSRKRWQRKANQQAWASAVRIVDSLGGTTPAVPSGDPGLGKIFEAFESTWQPGALRQVEPVPLSSLAPANSATPVPAWPSDREARALVFKALHANLPLPWEPASDKFQELGQQAWVEVLHRDPTVPAPNSGRVIDGPLYFLSTTPAERRQFLTAFASGIWTANRPLVLIAAKAAGFQVPDAQLVNAHLQVSGGPIKVPPPALLQHLEGLRAIATHPPFLNRDAAMMTKRGFLPGPVWPGSPGTGTIEPSPTTGGWDLVLVGCGDTKAKGKRAAIELYTGPVFKSHLAILRHLGVGVSYILSAKHGFLAPQLTVSPYDENLDDPAKRERWNEEVVKWFREYKADNDASHLRHRDTPHVLVLAGAKYVDGWADRVRALGFVVDDPLRGMQLGERRAFAGWFEKNIQAKAGEEVRDRLLRAVAVWKGSPSTKSLDEASAQTTTTQKVSMTTKKAGKRGKGNGTGTVEKRRQVARTPEERVALKWPGTAEARRLVVLALQRKRPFPWGTHNSFGNEGRRVENIDAWTEALGWDRPLHKDPETLGQDALSYLAMTDEEQIKRRWEVDDLSRRRYERWATVLAAKAAGFDVPAGEVDFATREVGVDPQQLNPLRMARLVALKKIADATAGSKVGKNTKKREQAQAKREARDAAQAKKRQQAEDKRNALAAKKAKAKQDADARRERARQKKADAERRKKLRQVAKGRPTVDQVLTLAALDPTAWKVHHHEGTAFVTRADRQVLDPDDPALVAAATQLRRAGGLVHGPQRHAASGVMELALRQKPSKREATRQALTASKPRCKALALLASARKRLRGGHRAFEVAERRHKRVNERLGQVRARCPEGCKAECAAEARVEQAARDLQQTRGLVLAAQRQLAQAEKAAIATGGLPPERAPKAAAPAAQTLRVRATPLPPPAPLEGPDGRSCEDVCHLQLLGGQCGAKASILIDSPTGARSVPTRYCLIEAERVITSHNARDYMPNPDYPPATQERRYERDRGEQDKVRRIAEQPKPELIFSTAATPLDGTSIVTTSGVALGGNGRAMGVAGNYLRGRTDYRDYLRKVASEFGFTRAQVDQLQHPTVVRVIDAPRPEWVRLVRDLNQGLTQSLDVHADAVSLARQLSPAVLSLLAANLDGESDLADFLDSAASLPLVDSLRRSGVITTSNANRLVQKNGLLSDEGRLLLIRQLGAAVLADADLLESLSKELRNTLTRSAPYWLAAAAEGGIWDLRPKLLMAARDLHSARVTKKTVPVWYAQQDIFAPPATKGDPLGQRMLLVLDRLGGKPRIFSLVARTFAAEAASTSGGLQTSLMGQRTPEQTLDEAVDHHARIDFPKGLRAAVGELGEYHMSDDPRGSALRSEKTSKKVKK